MSLFFKDADPVFQGAGTKAYPHQPHFMFLFSLFFLFLFTVHAMEVCWKLF